MKVSEHFLLQEFVPEELFQQFGSRATWFIDRRIVAIAELIWTRFAKPVTVNNWHIGGTFQNRGFRTPSTTVGAKLSQHRFGRAIDVNVSGKDPQEVYYDIIKTFSIYQGAGVTTVEDVEFTSGWTHLDCRDTGSKQLLIVKP